MQFEVHLEQNILTILFERGFGKVTSL